jgi:histidinol phosphatase-like enzyme
MLVPIKSNGSPSTIRLDLYRNFQHYSSDQRNRAVADAMSWWELIKDCFNHFNHAKALACLFDVVKYQQALTNPNISDDDAQSYEALMFNAFQGLGNLIDSRYFSGIEFTDPHKPLGQLWIQLGEDRDTRIQLGQQFLLFRNPRDVHFWGVLIDQLQAVMNPGCAPKLIAKIHEFSKENNNSLKSNIFFEINDIVDARAGLFKTHAITQHDPAAGAAVIFLIGDTSVGQFWAD